MKNRGLIWIMVLLFAVAMSIPFLVPKTGWLALIGFLPLLCADAIADQLGIKRFFWFYFVAFVLWNAATTFWVWNATVGGAIFAILYNSIQMAIIWGIFRLSKKGLDGVLPYLLLMTMWIAWEKVYFRLDFSWPWLTLGNAFARTTGLVQWYEYTGSLGGSLWVWLCNLGIFGLFCLLTGGPGKKWTAWGFVLSVLGVIAAFVAPIVLSSCIYSNYEEKSEGSLDVLVAQPNFDPYQKFESLTQAQQNAVLVDLVDSALEGRDSSKILILAPETFTSDIVLSQVEASPTVQTMRHMLQRHPGAQLLFGASTYEYYNTHAAPSLLARKYGDTWVENHNSAFLLKADGSYDLFHKSKLVIGTELTPLPKIFVPFDDWLSKKLHVSGLMGRCIGQDEISLLNWDNQTPIGCAVCYESVYGEYCTDYVRKGAKAMTVITNDAWWGDTPGYRQHLSYARLRAIELRRDIARCGNTGISAFIDQKGDVLSESEWWTKQTLSGKVNLNSFQTAFVRYGDIVGRVCTFAFLLLLLLALVRGLIKRV